MSRFPKSPTEMTRGMAYFPRLLDKMRLHAAGELSAEYQPNLGKARAADGMCCNFLRVSYEDLRERVLQGGSDEEILDWCFEHGRCLNEDDFTVWNGFITKLGWNDSATRFLLEAKKRHGIEDRDDISSIPQLIDYDEGRIR